LIKIASASGCNYVKIQKRTPDLCVPTDQQNLIKDTPWGRIPYIQYKNKIEFNIEQIEQLVNYSKQEGICLFASVWDNPSCIMMSHFTNIVKIPSAMITNLELCKLARKQFNTLIISTGMSTENEIEECVKVCDPDIIMHTNSTYPCPVDLLNLNYIKWLKNKWPTKQIGYSGHEYGLVTTFAAAAIGVEWIERHITLNHNMWGSDHLSSLEPSGLFKLVKGVRDVESSLGLAAPRTVSPTEQAKLTSLRK